MISILGYIDVDPADRDRLVASTVDLQRATREDEPGCILYAMAADPVDPGRITIVELWDSAASLAAHFEHPNFFATGAVLRSVPRLGGQIEKYRIDAVAPVKDAGGNYSTSFETD